MTLERPALAFACDPARIAHVFSADTLADLARLTRMLDATPMARFDDARAQALLGEAEILVTGWGCPVLDGAVLANAPRLRLIAHAAGTVKGHVRPEVFAAGLRVTHAAEANAIPVAEFTLAAILFANKAVFRFRERYAADRGRAMTGRWVDQPIGNFGRTIGIVGASRIGRRVIDLLRPFDFTILLADPFVDAAEAARLGVTKADLATVMARSDVVSLHAPALPETRHMIGAAELARMRDGATLINTARGALVDQAALIAEVQNGRIDAILDVTEPEVPGPDSPLFALPNVFLTPHIAGAIGTERTRLGDMVRDEIARYIAGEPLRQEVRAEALAVMA